MPISLRRGKKASKDDKPTTQAAAQDKDKRRQQLLKKKSKKNIIPFEEPVLVDSRGWVLENDDPKHKKHVAQSTTANADNNNNNNNNNNKYTTSNSNKITIVNTPSTLKKRQPSLRVRNGNNNNNSGSSSSSTSTPSSQLKKGRNQTPVSTPRGCGTPLGTPGRHRRSPSSAMSPAKQLELLMGTPERSSPHNNSITNATGDKSTTQLSPFSALALRAKKFNDSVVATATTGTGAGAGEISTSSPLCQSSDRSQTTVEIRKSQPQPSNRNNDENIASSLRYVIKRADSEYVPSVATRPAVYRGEKVTKFRSIGAFRY